jgi:hypothetical protein
MVLFSFLHEMSPDVSFFAEKTSPVEPATLFVFDGSIPSSTTSQLHKPT